MAASDAPDPLGARVSAAPADPPGAPDPPGPLGSAGPAGSQRLPCSPDAAGPAGSPAAGRGPFDLRGQVALVTGAGSETGIGFAAARLLRDAGAHLVLVSTTDRIEQRARDLVAEAAGTAPDEHDEHDGPAAIGLVADLTAPGAAEQVVQAALARFGRIDILVNNAGMSVLGSPEPFAPVEAMTDDIWALGIDRNLTSCFRMTRAVLPAMRGAGYGRIVNVASTTGVVGANPDEASYAAAKAGMVGFTRAVAVETAAAGITCNAVAPGWIATGSQLPEEARAGQATPVGRSGTPGEVAAAIAFLASPAASYVTGAVLVVDGANSVAEARG